MVEATLDYARDRFEVDWDRVVLTGFSEGAIHGDGAGNPSSGPLHRCDPSGWRLHPGDRRPSSKLQMVILVSTSWSDRSTGLRTQARMAASDFEKAGYEVDLRMFPDTGHEFPRRTTQELGRALRFVLGE